MLGSTPASDWAEAPDAGLAPGRLLRLRMRNHMGLKIGFGIVGTLVLLALLAPLLSAHGPYDQDLTKRLLPPVWHEAGTWQHLLGTDHLGRDYLARFLYGARISLAVGFLAACIGGIIGTTLGICAGYFGGWVDRIVSYLVTCQLAMPTLLLAMALVFLIGPSVTVVIVIIGFTHWTYFLVVARATTLQIRQHDFVAAAQAFGSSRPQLLFHEILPNLRNQIIVVFTLEVGIAIVAEASLSFLGVGVPSPVPSWGLMISEGRAFMFLRPELILLPGAALFLLVIAINMMGDALSDVMTPEHRA